MSMLFHAHMQWRKRPADERYKTLKDLHAVTLARKQASVSSRVRLPELTFAPTEGDGLSIVSRNGTQVAPTHWSLSQLCNYTGVPVEWLRRVDTSLASDNLNWGMRHSERSELVMLWANVSQPGIVRCFNTPSYGRLWDADVVDWVRAVTEDESNGWKRPPARTDDKYPSGYYAGDRNIFIFMVNDRVRIDDGTPAGLGRGFFVWNSEVKQMSFGFSGFLYRYVCGNHIVWGAESLFSIRMPHLGEGMSRRAASEFNRIISAYVSSSAAQDQMVIDAARKKQVAPNPAETVEWLNKRGFPEKQAVEIVARAERAGDDPTNLWNIINAATSWSQELFQHADGRDAFDRKASQLLSAAL